MDEKKLVFIFLIILLLGNIQAIEIQCDDEFSQGETMLAKISGNFIDPPGEKNIRFYRKHVPVSITPNFEKINEDYYISGVLLDRDSGNYSVKIENVKYYIEGGKTSEEDIEIPFTINDEIADFYVSPGVLTTNQDFPLKIQNLKDSSLTISFSTSTSSGSSESLFASIFGTTIEDDEAKSITLRAGEIKNVNFKIENIKEPTLKKLFLSSSNQNYEIPVFIFANSSEVKEEKNFEFSKKEINITLSTNTEKIETLYLENTGTEDLENIEISISEILDQFTLLNLEEIGELDSNDSVKIMIKINSPNQSGTYQGQLKAKESTDDISTYTYCALTLNFIPGYTPPDGDDPIPGPEEDKTCAQLGGQICLEDQTCSGETTTDAFGSSCCIGECQTKSDNGEENSWGKILGWIILIAIVAGLAWFYFKKYRKKTTKHVNLLDVGTRGDKKIKPKD